MTPDEVRARNERALQAMRDVIDTRRSNLELAERNFPGSPLATLARELLDASEVEYAELEARCARVLSLIEARGE